MRTPANFSARRPAGGRHHPDAIQVSDELADRLARLRAGGVGLSSRPDVRPRGPRSLPRRCRRCRDIRRSHDHDAVSPRRSRVQPSVFELFRAPRSGDFSPAAVLSYRGALQPTDRSSRGSRRTPALMERKARGPGPPVEFGPGLEWNDLAVKPVFLPFVTRSRNIWRFSPSRRIIDGGTLLPGPRRPAGRGAAATRGATIAVAPSGTRVPVETEDGALELTEQGFYDVRTQGAAADSATTLASNVDLTESDLASLDPKELAAAVAGRSSGGLGGLANGRPSDEAQAQAQRLWWYLLVAGGLLLAAETMLSNRLSQNGARVS